MRGPTLRPGSPTDQRPCDDAGTCSSWVCGDGGPCICARFSTGAEQELRCADPEDACRDVDCGHENAACIFASSLPPVVGCAWPNDDQR